MTNEQEKTLREYAEIKQEIAALETRADALKVNCIDIVQELGVNEIAIGEVGKITLGATKKWKYPEAIEQAEKDIKTAKKVAEQKGDATYTESPRLAFYSIKEQVIED